MSDEESIKGEARFTRMERKIDEVVNALQALIRIEERQVSINVRMQDYTIVSQDHERRLRTLENESPEEMGKRLGAIEQAMPGLIEMRKWVVMGVLSGIGLIGLGVVKLVILGV